MTCACTDQYSNKEVGYTSLRWPLSWKRVETKIDEAAALTLFCRHRAVKSTHQSAGNCNVFVG